MVIAQHTRRESPPEVLRAWVEWSVSLPLPISGNHAYNPGNHRTRMDSRARAWLQLAVLTWKQAGLPFIPLAEAMSYRLSVEYTIYCDGRRDIDSSVKLMLDSIMHASGVDDRYVYTLIGRKVPTPKRADQRLDVAVRFRR